MTWNSIFFRKVNIQYLKILFLFFFFVNFIGNIFIYTRKIKSKYKYHLFSNTIRNFFYYVW